MWLFPSQPPARAPASTGARHHGDIYEDLAHCESTHNPRAVSASGKYYGAWQFALSTWRSLGGTGNPIDHSYEEQGRMARKIPVSAWRSQFPHCARKLGVA